MHVFSWDAKGSELYMRNNGIPLSAKALGFLHHDAWTCGYESMRLLRQLLWTDSTDLGMFIAKHMPPAFVTHVQDIVNSAP